MSATTKKKKSKKKSKKSSGIRWSVHPNTKHLVAMNYLINSKPEVYGNSPAKVLESALIMAYFQEKLEDAYDAEAAAEEYK